LIILTLSFTHRNGHLIGGKTKKGDTMNDIEQAEALIQTKDQRIIKLISPSGQVSYKVADKRVVKHLTDGLVKYRGFQVEIIEHWVRRR
jgi:hypothetical protein